MSLRTAAIVKGGLDLLVRQTFEHQADHTSIAPSALFVLIHSP